MYVYVFRDLRVPAGHVAPGSSFCTKTRRQDVQMCMFALQSLSVFLPHSITQSYRTAVTCSRSDLGWSGKYTQFPSDNSLSKHTNKSAAQCETSVMMNITKRYFFLCTEKFNANIFYIHNDLNNNVSCQKPPKRIILQLCSSPQLHTAF